MIALPPIDQQISFAHKLWNMRQTHLQEALGDAVQRIGVAVVDAELSQFALPDSLGTLARSGLRGELMFLVPSVLKTNPYLLGYYRLLYGYSKKSFYTSSTGLISFQRAEERGELPGSASGQLAELCGALNRAGALLLDGLDSEMLTRDFIDDLTILTLGPQLRGSANVLRGNKAVEDVFQVVHEIVHPNVVESTERNILVRNAAGRLVSIAFGSDPDIAITEEQQSGRTKHVIAIEIKGGQDFSNIHNRVGEAEKSHQKAKDKGFTQCWTVLNVDQANISMCMKESPTTDRFFLLSDLICRKGKEYDEFREDLVSLVGIS